MSEHQRLPAPATSAAPARTPRAAVLRRSCASCGASTSVVAGTCPDCKRKKLQPQLAVGGSQDAAELEADRVADAVMSGGAAGATMAAEGRPGPVIQRSGATAAPGAAEPAAPPIVEQVLAGSGQALDGGARAFMETRFARDFSRVRVHADAQAAASARAVNAHAYTIGDHLVFATSRYEPATRAGRRLLAHELTHVVQQTGAQAGIVQRDLATPPPAAVREQDDLTDAQIQAAIQFNQHRYNAANTRLIQSLLGGEVTGAWTPDNIRAIAVTQREYGLTSDGKVGDATFRFLNNEQRLEGMSTSNANCLTAFQVDSAGATPIVRDAPSGTCTLSGFIRTASQFSSRCRCADFEYRQFVRGHVLHNRAGAQVADLGATQFGRLPGGALTAAFQEDGDRLDPVAVNYGHRANGPTANPEDHYVDDTDTDDQANGCRYRSNDTMGFANVPGIPDCQVGDVIDADINFRGEIQRNGAAVQSKFFNGLRGRFTVR